MKIINGSEKSSRSKADLFEVLIADGLTKYFKIKKSFEHEIFELRNTLLSFRDGRYRIAEQETNARRALEIIIDFLSKHKINKIKDVDWIGRKHQTEHTLSDIDLTDEGDNLIGISVKSVRTGTGTQKNLGYGTVKEYLSVDIDVMLEDMWNNVRKELIKNKLPMIAELNKGEIKNSKYKHPIIKSIGCQCGLPVQKDAVEQSVNNFNRLSATKKSEFLKCIYGIEEDKKLINLVCQPHKIEIYWNDKYNAIIEGRDITAKKATDKSYYIEHDGIPILRVQTSFTNGVGISAFCQRAFLMDL